MKSLKFVVPLVLAILVSASVRAEEKKAEKFTGTVEKAPADAKAGVVAVLKVDDKITLNLVTTDKELTEKITKEVDKKVVVEGTKDGDNVTVKSIKEAAHEKAAK